MSSTRKLAHIWSGGHQKLVAYVPVLGRQVPPGLGHEEVVESAGVVEVSKFEEEESEEAKSDEEECGDLVSGSHNYC